MAIDLLKEYLREYSGNIMILAGITLLGVGVLFVNLFGSIVSVFTLFFGIVFLAYGLFARLGLFYQEWRSLSGLGTVLFCISVIFLALCIALMEFLSVKGIDVRPIYYRGFFVGNTEIIALYRPYAWLSLSSLWAGLGTFVVGLIVKVYCYFR
jgi:hypothetical protein